VVTADVVIGRDIGDDAKHDLRVVGGAAAFGLAGPGCRRELADALFLGMVDTDDHDRRDPSVFHQLIDDLVGVP